MQTVNVLVIDDANVTGASDFDVKEFQLLVRLRTQRQLPLIITTNANSKSEFREMWSGQAEAVVAENCHYIGMGGVVLRDEDDFGVMF
jgi:DNA replication protein DnaC